MTSSCRNFNYIVFNDGIPVMGASEVNLTCDANSGTITLKRGAIFDRAFLEWV